MPITPRLLVIHHGIHRLASLILLLSFPAICQPPPANLTSRNLHQWGAVTLFHGLPSNHVRAIAQDRDGTLWFGTDGGLARYDGRRIEKVSFAELSFARVLSLELDPTGALWLGTDNGAARVIDGQLSPINETLGKAISAVAFRDNRVALVSEQGFIFDCRVEADGSAKVKVFSPEEHGALRIEANNRGLPLTSVVISGTTLLCGSLGRGLLVVENNEVKEAALRPRPFFVEALRIDAQSRLWVGAQASESGSGLYRSDDLLRAVKIEAETGNLTALEFDGQNRLWAGTRGRGAFVFETVGDTAGEAGHFTFENTAGGLRSNNISSVCVDREGVVWFGTEKGVSRYDPRAMRVEPVSTNNIESNFVRALYQSADGFIWCGTNRGLFFRPQVSAAWREVRALQGKAVYAIGEDAHGRLLVGTAQGLFVGGAPPNQDSLALPFTTIDGEPSKGTAHDSIRAVCLFRGAAYVANYGNGVERVTDAGRAVVLPLETEDSRKRQVVSLCNDGDRRLLVGTAGAGVFVFDGEKASTIDALDPLRGNTIWSINSTEDGSIWLATSDGLFLFGDGRLQPVLQDVDARAVMPAKETQSAVWCATAESGLFKVSLEKNEAGASEMVVARFDTEQGLPSQKVFALSLARLPDKAQGHALLIGTTYGVVFYEPNRLSPILKAERVSGSRSYQPTEFVAGLALEYPQNSLLVDVIAAGSRTFPEQFQYAFLLFDSSGKLVQNKLSGESQVLVENLPAGNYRLIARAYTLDLVPSEPITLRFEVERAPFPWTSAGLAFLLALALLAVWWGYYQNKRLAGANDTLALTNRQLAETRTQLADETERERRRIARDLHDQTLADLRRLLMLTDQFGAEVVGGEGAKTNGDQHSVSPATFRGEIESVSAEIRRICEDLSPSVLENVGLAAALEWALANAVAHLPPDRKFEYEIHCEDGIEEKLKLAPVKQIHLYRIAQEVITNISLHANATTVRLLAKVAADGEFVLEIEDNGKGFDFAVAGKRGRGIANIRSRANLLGADVTWLSAAQGGTLFRLRKTSGLA